LGFSLEALGDCAQGAYVAFIRKVPDDWTVEVDRNEELGHLPVKIEIVGVKPQIKDAPLGMWSMTVNDVAKIGVTRRLVTSARPASPPRNKNRTYLFMSANHVDVLYVLELIATKLGGFEFSMIGRRLRWNGRASKVDVSANVDIVIPS
jgi:hypothetical protein